MEKYRARFLAWWHREPVQRAVTATLLTGAVGAYAAIFYLGRKTFPATSPDVPFFLRLHIERILACAGGVLGMSSLYRCLFEGRSLLQPLVWIFFSSLVHLSSLAVQLRWI